MKKIVLIDWSWFLFRAWYAYPAIINDRGENINVVYGFLRMMLKLLLDKPDYFVIAWDSPVKTKRHEEYPDYKANRIKMEDEFKQQLPWVREIVENLWIPSFAAPWYEADDIISTLVSNYKDWKDLSLQVFTSDKDLKQFLTDNIIITDSMKNQTTTLLEFKKEFWFEPPYIVDYLALIWDSADNIKRVPWIGPKKASDLVCKYHTVENIYDHIDELTPDLKEKMLQGKESAFFSKELIKLMEVPELKWVELDKCSLRIDFNKWSRVLFDEWKMNGLKKWFEELKKKMMQPQQLGLF